MTHDALAGAAARAKATDLFVLSEIDAAQLIHIDGVGRGEGWAGNIQVSRDHERLVAQALDGLVRVDAERPVRIFGPYWSERAALVPAGDYLVVFGGPELTEDDQELQAASAEAAWVTGDIPAAKRLADELEMSQAVLSIATLPRSSVAAAARGLATRSAGALSCEFGAVVLADGTLYMAESEWSPDATDAEIVEAIQQIPAGELSPLFVEDDLATSPFAQHPLGFDDGLVTRCAVKLGSHGVLVVAHHGTTPRGFTALCRRVATGISEAGSDLLDDVLQRV